MLCCVVIVKDQKFKSLSISLSNISRVHVWLLTELVYVGDMWNLIKVVPKVDKQKDGKIYFQQAYEYFGGGWNRSWLVCCHGNEMKIWSYVCMSMELPKIISSNHDTHVECLNVLSLAVWLFNRLPTNPMCHKVDLLRKPALKSRCMSS